MKHKKAFRLRSQYTDLISKLHKQKWFYIYIYIYISTVVSGSNDLCSERPPAPSEFENNIDIFYLPLCYFNFLFVLFLCYII